jgi:hypothetical protein
MDIEGHNLSFFSSLFSSIWVRAIPFMSESWWRCLPRCPFMSRFVPSVFDVLLSLQVVFFGILSILFCALISECLILYSILSTEFVIYINISMNRALSIQNIIFFFSIWRQKQSRICNPQKPLDCLGRFTATKSVHVWTLIHKSR